MDSIKQKIIHTEASKMACMLSKVRHYISNIDLKTFIMPYLSHVSSMAVRFGTNLEKFRENVDKTSKERPTCLSRIFESHLCLEWKIHKMGDILSYHSS